MQWVLQLTTVQWKTGSIKILACPYPPYSPDLALNNFSLFPKFKMTMNGKHFESIQDTEAGLTLKLKAHKRSSRTASGSGKNREIKCVHSGTHKRGGGYQEIDKKCAFYCNIFLKFKHSLYIFFTTPYIHTTPFKELSISQQIIRSKSQFLKCHL